MSCEGVAAEDVKSQFVLVFDDRPSFRAKELHVVGPRWHRPRPEERNEKEGERERERERRCEDVR